MPKRPLMIATFIAALVVLAGAGVAINDAQKDGSVQRVASTVSPDGAPVTTIAPYDGGNVGAPEIGMDEDAAKRSALAQDSFAEPSVGSDAVASGGGSSAGSVSAPVPGPGGSPPVPNQQQVIKTADMRLEVARGSFRRAFDQATATATGAGGFVVNSSTERVNDRVGSGMLVLRVPADRFDAVRSSLAGLGTVQEEHQGGQDVSGQLVDIDARLRSLKAQEDALVTLMSKARTVGETIEVQSQLFNIRTQIEQLAAQQANLKDSVALSTITVFMAEKGVATSKPEDPDNGIGAAFQRAIDGAVAVVGGTIIVLGYLIPLSVLALIVWFLARLAWRHWKPEATTDPAPAS